MPPMNSGSEITKIEPKIAPCSEPMPPITIIIRNSIETASVNCSGLMNLIWCAYSVPASPVSPADSAKLSVLYADRFTPMLCAETSESRIAMNARPVGDLSRLNTTNPAPITQARHR